MVKKMPMCDTILVHIIMVGPLYKVQLIPQGENMTYFWWQLLYFLQGLSDFTINLKNNMNL